MIAFKAVITWAKCIFSKRGQKLFAVSHNFFFCRDTFKAVRQNNKRKIKSQLKELWTCSQIEYLLQLNIHHLTSNDHLEDEPKIKWVFYEKKMKGDLNQIYTR